MAETLPGCGIGWTTLAGIGSVESRHGTYDGSSVDAFGQVAPIIRGIPLDGGPGVAEIPDTDGGAMDGDPVHDRAMGPMQFIPETWLKWGVDANGDGRVDPRQHRRRCPHGRPLPVCTRGETSLPLPDGSRH